MVLLNFRGQLGFPLWSDIFFRQTVLCSGRWQRSAVFLWWFVRGLWCFVPCWVPILFRKWKLRIICPTRRPHFPWSGVCSGFPVHTSDVLFDTRWKKYCPVFLHESFFGRVLVENPHCYCSSFRFISQTVFLSRLCAASLYLTLKTQSYFQKKTVSSLRYLYFESLTVGHRF